MPLCRIHYVKCRICRCPTPAVASTLMPETVQVKDSKTKTAKLQAFRFDGSSSVRITCKLEICKGKCNPVSDEMICWHGEYVNNQHYHCELADTLCWNTLDIFNPDCNCRLPVRSAVPTWLRSDAKSVMQMWTTSTTTSPPIHVGLLWKYCFYMYIYRGCCLSVANLDISAKIVLTMQMRPDAIGSHVILPLPHQWSSSTRCRTSRHSRAMPASISQWLWSANTPSLPVSISNKKVTAAENFWFKVFKE